MHIRLTRTRAPDFLAIYRPGALKLLFCFWIEPNEMKRPVQLVDYDPRWTLLYEEEKRRIMNVIGHIVMKNEHIGSTAVPDLGAKPIIDIMVVVNHISEARARRARVPLQDSERFQS